jgi:hypothetical protein
MQWENRSYSLYISKATAHNRNFYKLDDAVALQKSVHCALASFVPTSQLHTKLQKLPLRSVLALQCAVRHLFTLLWVNSLGFRRAQLPIVRALALPI